MTLKLNRVCDAVKVHVRAKFHQAECSGLWACPQAFFALSRNGDESNNSVLWPWPLTYDFKNQ